MRLRSTTAVTLAAAVLLGVLLPATPSLAKDDLNARKKTVQSKITQSQNDVESLTARAARATAAVQKARADLGAARARVAVTEASLASARASYTTIGVQLAAARTQERRAQGQVVELRARMAETQRLVGLLARSAYQHGGSFTEIAVALQATSPADLTGRLQAVQSVARAQNALFDQLAVDKADLAANEARLSAVRADVERQRAAAAANVRAIADLARRAAQQQGQVSRLLADRQSALRSVAAARTAELDRLARLKAEQKRIRSLIAARASSGTGGIRGELFWPIPGAPMVEGVGPRIHPVYGYRSCHTGVDIAGGYGAAIQAAAAGTVISTSSGGAYGNVTIIDHGNGLSTFYAHQSARAVGQGQHVTRGQVIGYVGATGWVTGPHLHFEVHVNGVPYDPMGWFGGVKRPVAC